MRVTRKLFADGHCRMAHAEQRRAVSGLRLGVQGLEPGNRQMAIEMRREWGSDSVVGSQPSLKGASHYHLLHQTWKAVKRFVLTALPRRAGRIPVPNEGGLTEFKRGMR